MLHARSQHPNAVLTPEGLRRIVGCVLDRGGLEATAHRFQIDNDGGPRTLDIDGRLWRYARTDPASLSSALLTPGADATRARWHPITLTPSVMSASTTGTRNDDAGHVNANGVDVAAGHTVVTNALEQDEIDAHCVDLMIVKPPFSACVRHQAS